MNQLEKGALAAEAPLRTGIKPEGADERGGRIAPYRAANPVLRPLCELARATSAIWLTAAAGGL
jgi:hypothetical protein